MTANGMLAGGRLAAILARARALLTTRPLTEAALAEAWCLHQAALDVVATSCPVLPAAEACVAAVLRLGGNIVCLSVDLFGVHPGRGR